MEGFGGELAAIAARTTSRCSGVTMRRRREAHSRRRQEETALPGQRTGVAGISRLAGGSFAFARP
jgi:hypothetical protein